MGCDIHMHVEVKINDKWEHYDQPRIPRNYKLFERMAGVRGEVENAICPPRGLPTDISAMTKFCSDFWDSDGHSHSWLNAQEISELTEWGEENLEGRFGKWDMEFSWHSYLFGNSYAGFVEYPEERPKGLEDVRFVFWFDN